MGDENKITDIEEKTKSQFLSSQFIDDEGKDPVYSLGEEFSKTKKNRNFYTYLGVFGYLAVIILSAVVITLYVEQQNRDASFSITGFGDLQLQELLDNAKKHEKKLEDAQRGLEKLKVNMEGELGKATSDSERRKIRTKYNRLISEKNSEISSTQKDIANYDLKLRDNIRKAEAIVDNYKKLHKLQMDEERKNYIRKYNPVFFSPTLRRILRERISRKDLRNPALKKYRPVLEREKILTKSEYNDIRERIKKHSLIMKRMRKIPYINSVKPSVRHMDRLSKTLINDYEAMWYDMALKMERKNIAIRNYRYAFDYLSRIKPESGYIIDARNPENIQLFINAIHNVKTGDMGLVFRSDDDFIGTIQFFKGSYGTWARVIELQGSKKIQPFDKILLKKSENDIQE